MRHCDYATSKALQGLGYDRESCCMLGDLAAPRLDDALEWIRANYQIACYSSEVYYGGSGWAMELTDLRDGDTILEVQEFFDSRDDALEAAVTAAVKIIINSKRKKA